MDRDEHHCFAYLPHMWRGAEKFNMCLQPQDMKDHFYVYHLRSDPLHQRGGNVMQGLLYNRRCLEATVVVIWCTINKIELNRKKWDQHLGKMLSSYSYCQQLKHITFQVPYS